MKNLKTINVTLRVRLISNFFQLIITTAFLPFTALYLNEMVNAKFSGIFLSILIILNIPINLLGGQIIDSFPKRKTVITYQVILVISLFFMAISLIENLNNIFLFCLTYAIFSVIWGLQFPAMSAIVMDAITPDVENIVYKIDYWLGNTATALGLFFGSYLYNINKSMILFIATVIFFFTLLAFCKWLPKVSNEHSNNKLSDIHRSYYLVIKDRSYLLLIASFCLLLSAEFSTSSYVALRLQEQFNKVSILGISITGVKMFSILMVVNTIVVITFSYPVMKINNVLKTNQVLLIGLFIYIFGYVNITYLNFIFPLIIAMIIAAIGEILIFPIIQEKRYKLTPQDSRGVYSAIGDVGFSFAELIGRIGIVLGTLLNKYEMSVYMLIILLTGAIGLYFSFYKKK